MCVYVCVCVCVSVCLRHAHFQTVNGSAIYIHVCICTHTHTHTHTYTHTQVISACFSYLELIKKEGVPQYVLDEVQQLSEVFFKYKEAEDAGKVIRLAGNMHRYPEAKDWVAGPALLRDLKMDAVN